MEERYNKDGINIEKMKSFIKFFDEEVIPAMKDKNGNPLDHLREVAKRRRQEVEQKKEYREKILATQEDNSGI